MTSLKTSIKTITYLSDIGCLEIQGASLSLMVLSRQSLLQLMRLTEDVPDVRQELLNRLLSGKKLTGRDEQDIRRLWQEKVDAMQESATRQREQDTIRKFTEGNKSE